MEGLMKTQQGADHAKSQQRAPVRKEWRPVRTGHPTRRGTRGGGPVKAKEKSGKEEVGEVEAVSGNDAGGESQNGVATFMPREAQPELCAPEAVAACQSAVVPDAPVVCDDACIAANDSEPMFLVSKNDMETLLTGRHQVVVGSGDACREVKLRTPMFKTAVVKEDCLLTEGDFKLLEEGRLPPGVEVVAYRNLVPGLKLGNLVGGWHIGGLDVWAIVAIVALAFFELSAGVIGLGLADPLLFLFLQVPGVVLAGLTTYVVYNSRRRQFVARVRMLNREIRDIYDSKGHVYSKSQSFKIEHGLVLRAPIVLVSALKSRIRGHKRTNLRLSALRNEAVSILKRNDINADFYSVEVEAAVRVAALRDQSELLTDLVVPIEKE